MHIRLLFLLHLSIIISRKKLHIYDNVDAFHDEVASVHVGISSDVNDAIMTKDVSTPISFD